MMYTGGGAAGEARRASMSEHTFTDEERERFRRQLALIEIGEKGQARLLCGRVLIIGAGGLGSPAALYLASAGVGALGIVDGDRLELSNLQRQIMHRTRDIGRLKVDSAQDALRELWPAANVRTYAMRFSRETARRLLADYDFVIDATDNFDAKFSIADCCHFAGKPYCHGGIWRFLGQAMTVHPGKSACYRCVFGEPPPNDGSEPQGPLGVVPGVIGSIQAAEAIKHIVGVGEPLINRVLTFDAMRMICRTVPVKKNSQCPLCGDRPSIRA